MIRAASRAAQEMRVPQLPCVNQETRDNAVVPRMHEITIGHFCGDIENSAAFTPQICGTKSARTIVSIWVATHPPALNRHLTKSRLNDALYFCECFTGT
jgi:hypothetical protein